MMMRVVKIEKTSCSPSVFIGRSSWSIKMTAAQILCNLTGFDLQIHTMKMQTQTLIFFGICSKQSSFSHLSIKGTGELGLFISVLRLLFKLKFIS